MTPIIINITRQTQKLSYKTMKMKSTFTFLSHDSCYSFSAVFYCFLQPVVDLINKIFISRNERACGKLKNENEKKNLNGKIKAKIFAKCWGGFD